MAWMSAAALGRKYNIGRANIIRKMERHGFKSNAKKQWREEDYIKAQAMGMEMDKRNLQDKVDDTPAGPRPSLTHLKLQRQVKRLDVEIKIAEAKLDEMMGKVVSVDRYKEQVQAVARLMLTWWDQAAEAAATKIKDASVLEELRNARDRASRDILELD